MDALFAAVDISTLSSNVSTLLVGFVAVGLLFTGYRYVKRTLFTA